MSAVIHKSLADLRRRKVQTAVITLVLFLSSLAAIMALTLLVESDAPFDHAFDKADGAHLTMTFSSAAVTPSQLRATGSTAGVSSYAGPWTVFPWSFHARGGRNDVVPLAGRDGPGGPVDRLTVVAGRWARTNEEVVLSQRLADELGLAVGDKVVSTANTSIPDMTIVGVAVAVGGDDVAAWTLPAGVPAVTAGKEQTAYVMVYRLLHSGSSREIAAVSDAISASLPHGAVLDTTNYLSVKLDADRTVAVMIPFLLAFSAFALIASALIIANLVSGAVIAGTRDIGIMKSVGFTPAQVITVIAGQMVGPALIGILFGVPAGILASQPFLADTAHAFGLPRTFGIAWSADAVGVAVILTVVIVTSVLSSWRAGRMSAASALGTGSAPSSSGGYRLARLTSRIPLPRALTLGVGDAFARPVRSAMTVIAIVIGIAAVTFSLGLSRSLSDVQAGISRDAQVQVTVYRIGGGGKGGGRSGPTDRELMSLIAAQPETARYSAEREEMVVVAGAGHPVTMTAYRGDSSWLGYPLISGRWFVGGGEAVAPTAFFTRTGHHIGDSLDAILNGQDLHLTLVGEIFDVQGDGVLLRTAYATLPGDPEANRYEVQLKPGSDANRYAGALESPSSGIDVRTNRENGTDAAFILINGTLAGLALILSLIALSGVLNTVVLNTREKAREIAILKAIGMTPRQVIAMVLASVVLLGVAAAVVGVPGGIVLHRNILILMGEIASATNVPSQYFNVFEPVVLAGLAALAIAIALLGALLPAGWAAGSKVTEVLQTE